MPLPSKRGFGRDKDRKALLNAVKEQFLLNRLVAASQAENTRNLGLQILFNRMEHMSDKMLLKTIRKLGKTRLNKRSDRRVLPRLSGLQFEKEPLQGVHGRSAGSFVPLLRERVLGKLRRLLPYAEIGDAEAA